MSSRYQIRVVPKKNSLSLFLNPRRMKIPPRIRRRKDLHRTMMRTVPIMFIVYRNPNLSSRELFSETLTVSSAEGSKLSLSPHYGAWPYL